MLINQAGTESGLPELSAALRLPVLQDPDRSVFEAWGASKWYLYFLDDQGELVDLYYHLDLPGSEKERFVALVDALVGAQP